jgi:FixJ family two-component response regulator
MSGIELHNYLIELGVRIPVVFISAHDEEGILRQVEQTGAPFLRKPIEAYLLIEAIRKAVESFK